MCVEIWPQLGVRLLQAVLVSLSVRFFPAHPAERFVAKWEGKGVAAYDVFAIDECAVE